MPRRILVVDDEPLKRITLQIDLSEQGYEVAEAADAATAKRLLEAQPFDVVVSDVRMPGMNGIDLLTHVKQIRPEVEVILMTAYATIETAVLAIKRGAYDYITKPFTTADLLEKLERLFATRSTAPAESGVERCGGLVAHSQSMKRIFEQVHSAALTDQTVLITGEHGTGKELLAEALHAHSSRRDQPLVRFHCIGPEVAALEAELFGQERGHGATARQKQGKYEAAEGGTLLLDALEELPAELQTRLLRAIEQAGSERAGSDTAPSASVRLICATSRDLAALVQQGGFREDLYYRLNVISISIPPLRDRPDDVPVLARHFVECYARQLGVPPAEISLHAIDELVRYPWPGNVRELEHVMERALALCGGGQADAGGKKTQIRPEHILPLGVEAADAPLPAIELGAAGPLNLTETVADIEKRMILLALRQCENNQARAAQRLGIPRTTLRDKMAKYSIPGM